MIAYYIVKFFSWLMCVSPKFVRNGVAHFLGSVAVMATPEWRLKMAAANVHECLGVDEARAMADCRGQPAPLRQDDC